MKQVEKKINQWEKQVRRLQRALYNRLADFSLTFDVDEEDRLIVSSKNLSHVGKVDKVFDGFNADLQLPFLAGIITYVKTIDDVIRKYYKGIGIEVGEVKKIDYMTRRMEDYVGKFARVEPLKLDTRTYLSNSIAGRKKIKDLTTGFRQQYISLKKTGKLERYYQQFMFDTIMQYDRIATNLYAEKEGLNYFWYRGGLIETSRQFCIKRDGKLFHKDTVDSWREDPDLPDPATASSYNPLIELGRWNCRHWLEWITDEVAERQVKSQNF